jgi:uncharacterized membrane protein YgcG
MRVADRARTLLKSALLAGGLLLLGATSAMAQSPIKLSNQITDQTGVLESSTARVQAALDGLQSAHNVQLWIVFIATSDSDTASALAQSTYEYNGLGGNDFLVLVAVDDHRYGWWEDTLASNSDIGTATGLDSATIDSLLASQMEPRFKSGDYPGGVVAFANGLSQAVGNGGSTGGKATPVTPGATPVTPGGSTSGVDSAVSTVLTTLVGLILVGAVVIVGYLWFRAWRRGRMSVEERDKQTGELARQANKSLVDTDDALTAASQDLGFAQAQFDDADTKPYGDAITEAQAQLKAAFAIRQMLDDSIPEDQPTKIQMYNQIIAACTAANGMVNAQVQRLQALRDLEKDAPKALAVLPKAIADLQGRLPAIQVAMKTLSGYAPSSWVSVKGNLEEADKRGDFAEQQVAKGNAALAATPPDAGAAAHAARAAQEALAGANQLLDAVVQAAKGLDDARGKLDEEIAAVENDLETAKSTLAGPAGAGAPASASGDIAKATALLRTAKAQAAAAAPDPLTALQTAQQANAAADAVLANIRQASDQALRAQAAYNSARATAAASVGQAQGFVNARKTGVGREARTRLAEAERHLAQADALATSDPAAATNEANIATNMATAAYNLAAGDFVDYERGRYPRGGGSWSGGGGAGGSDLGAALIGGIIGGMLSGGSNRGGGFGGTPWGSSGGWSGGSSSGSHSSSGGHGGGASFGGFGGGGGGHSSGGGGGGHGGGGGW